MSAPRPKPMTTCGTCYELSPEEIAEWAFCDSGLSPGQFITWLNEQFDTLEAIDPECER